MSERVQTRIFLAAIVIATFLAYAGSFGNEFIFDDISQIVENAVIRSPARLPDAFTHHLTYFSEDSQKEGKFYRPLQTLTLVADHFLWGLTPFGYHLTNTLLHALVGALCFLWAARITHDRLAAFLVALLYVVHPVHTEAVTYVSGRADSLCAIFLLIMVVCQRHFWEASATLRKAAWYGALCVSFAAALLCKELAVVFPFLLMACEYCLRQERSYTGIVNKRALFYLPLFAIMAAWFVVKNAIVTTETMVMHPASFATRLTSLPRLVFDYVRLSFFPTGLHMEYKLPFPRSLFQAGYGGPFVFTLFFVAACVAFWRKGRSDPRMKTVFFGLLWFMVGLLPYLNILFQLNAPFAEHWLYIPEMGFILAVVYWLICLANKNAQARKAIAAGCVTVALVFSSMTAKQNAVWKDAETFYTYTLRYAPYSATVYNNLALERIKKNDLSRAEEYLKKALELEPDYEVGRENLRKLEMDMRRRGLP